MRNLTKDPAAAARARAAEERNNAESGLKSISLATAGGAGGIIPGKKKPVFKSTLQPQNVLKEEKKVVPLPGLRPMAPQELSAATKSLPGMPNDEEYAAFLARLKEQMIQEYGPDWAKQPSPEELEPFKKVLEWRDRASVDDDLKSED